MFRPERAQPVDDERTQLIDHYSRAISVEVGFHVIRWQRAQAIYKQIDLLSVAWSGSNRQEGAEKPKLIAM